MTVNGVPNNEYQNYVMHDKVVQQNLVTSLKFPFNQWFSVSVYAYNPESPGPTVTIYQNGIPIIFYQGKLLNGPLENGCVGLYMNNLQPSLTVYNDDLQLEKLT